MGFDPVIFREYDIRGIFNKEFDLEFVVHLGRAYVSYFKLKKNKLNPVIAIGHDARVSSPDVVAALTNGIIESGGHVKLIGLVTTPMSYFTTFAFPNVDGSIMVTGSHNPPEYNGFKISVGRSTIFGSEIKVLEEIVDTQKYLSGSGTVEKMDIFPTYIDRYKNEFQNLKSIPIVLDCGNGAAGVIARKLYQAVGLDPLVLFEEPDGTFPNHHPDPTVEENLTDLKNQVRATGSLLGIGFDGDADRIGVVDETGNVVYGDELIALWGRFVLQKNPGAKIIGDVKCSDRVYSYIEKYGGTPIMWKTGHSLIKEKIKVEGAPFGGELSGHVFFSDRNYGYDDALYAGLRLIEIISQTGKTIKEILSDFPPAFNTPEIRIDTSEEKKLSIVETLKNAFPSSNKEYAINLIDGIRISFPDGWALARASNTQPVLVLRFESTSERGLQRIQGLIEGIVRPLL